MTTICKPEIAGKNQKRRIEMNDTTFTLTPEEVIFLGMKRPISDYPYLRKIGRKYMDTHNMEELGFASFVLMLMQCVYNAGRVDGIRAERRRRRH